MTSRKSSANWWTGSSTNLGDDVPLHFTAFHPDFKLLDKPATPPETLHRARKLAMEMGLKFVYEGNIYSDGGDTICPGCKRRIVRRSWHSVETNEIVAGKCRHCGTPIPGVFSQDRCILAPHAHRGPCHSSSFTLSFRQQKGRPEWPSFLFRQQEGDLLLG